MFAVTVQSIDSHTCDKIPVELWTASELDGMKLVERGQHPVAYDFSVISASGTPVHLHDWRGQPVILFFFATWGRICRAHLPLLSGLARSGATVLGISREDAARLAAFSEEYDLPFPLLADPIGLARGQFRITCLPTTICLCPQGTITACYRGDVDLERLMERLPERT